MKKHILPILAIVGIAVMLVANPASADSGTELRASIPFDFTVGKTLMPAGQYTVRTDHIGSGVLCIEARDGGRPVMIMTNTAYAAHSKNESSLVFQRYGNQYFLNEIVSSASGLSVELPTSKAEKRARLQEASLHNGNQADGDRVLVALNR